MNLGGEPERDDSGLPRVDIVVPDDARELDRDVQAYHRELRARRRHERRMRWHGPLTRDGVILPLLASCLVLALIAGVLLTLFTAAPIPESGPQGLPAGSADQADSPLALRGANLPASAALDVYGTRLPAGQLGHSVLALVPESCGCAATLARLASQARSAGVPVYLVGGGSLATVAEIQAETGQAGVGAVVAGDSSGVLARTYLPARAVRAGAAPTALLVTGHTVFVARALPKTLQLGRQLRILAAS